MTPEKFQSQLAGFYGSENLYHRSTPILIYYTDGIKWLQENGKCYWLTDLIASYQTTNFKQANDHQFWELIVADDRSAIVTCDDGDGNISVNQSIEHTDFLLPSLRIWVEIQEEEEEGKDRIFLYLPSEH
jgi:hypothetical protein